MKHSITQKGDIFAEEIRRQHRQSLFAKRRNIDSLNSGQLESQTWSKISIVDHRLEQQLQQFSTLSFNANDLPQLRNDIQSSDILIQHKAIIGIRKLLSEKANPPLQLIIDHELVPVFITLAEQSQFPQLKLQSTWCLTNIVAGNQNQSKTVIERGGIKMFISLLTASIPGIPEQAVCALGNIACDNSYDRDLILKNDGLKMMEKLLQMNINQPSQNLVKSLSWSISVICRVKPLPPQQEIEKSLELLMALIKFKTISDPSIISSILWALSHYSTTNLREFHLVEKLIHQGIVQQLVAMLPNREQTEQVLVPCLRIIGNVSTGSNEHLQYLFSLNLPSILSSLLDDKWKKSIRKDVCWILSNLASGTNEHVQVLINNAALMNKLLTLLREDGDEVRSQVVITVSNMADEGNKETLYSFLREVNFVALLGECLNVKGSKLLLGNCLESLECVLKVGDMFMEDGRNMMLVALYNHIEKIEQLQAHPSTIISTRALQILSNYFQLENPFDVGG